MALRDPHNALPSTPDEPAETAKNHFGLHINAENTAPVPTTGDPGIDYISSEKLEPLADPENKIETLIEGLESKEWSRVRESVNDARRLALYHPDLLLPILERTVAVVVKAMKNPRSALCKTSVMGASDIIKAFGNSLLEPSSSSWGFDQLLLQLLLKASDDKKFVCEEADRALKEMVAYTSPPSLLSKLHPYVSHPNLRIRAKAAMSISNCMLKMDLKDLKEHGMPSLVQSAAELLKDRLPEAREAARSMVLSMYKAMTENEEQKQEAWMDFCRSSLHPISSQSVLKIISS